MKLNFFLIREELLSRAALGDSEVSSSAAWNQPARHRPLRGPTKADANLVAAPSRLFAISPSPDPSSKTLRIFTGYTMVRRLNNWSQPVNISKIFSWSSGRPVP